MPEGCFGAHNEAMRIAIAALAMAGLVPLALAESPADAVVAVVKAYERMRTIIRAAVKNAATKQSNGTA